MRIRHFVVVLLSVMAFCGVYSATEAEAQSPMLKRAQPKKARSGAARKAPSKKAVARPKPKVHADPKGNSSSDFTDNSEPEMYVIEEPKVERPAPDKIYETVEQQAEFPGGQGAMMKWIANNLRYPELAQQNHIQGRVIVKFTIEKDGSVSNPTVVRGVDKDLDKEAVRLVKKMPKWRPGKDKGAVVRCYYTLPVNFKLQNM